MEKITVSLGQLHIAVANPRRNFDVAVQMIHEAARNGSALILFPELWTSGYDLANAAAYLPTNREFLGELSALARENHIAIGGSYLTGRGGLFYNTFTLIQPDGSYAPTYDKTHLFRLMAEDRYLASGQHLQQVDLGWLTAGLAVCYDLRFPEMFRRYALEGTRSVLICSEWSLRRVTHWQTLLRARAIENQVFMFATNAVGQSGDDLNGGRSAVLTPWGDAVVEGSDTGEELLTGQIDLKQQDQVRSLVPVFADRRPDVYA